MAEESTIRNSCLHGWQRADPLVSLHLHMSATNWEYMETQDIRRSALHGTASHGGDVDLGHLRQPYYGLAHLPDSLYHCSKNDERTATIKISGASGLHLQLSVRAPQPKRL